MPRMKVSQPTTLLALTLWLGGRPLSIAAGSSLSCVAPGCVAEGCKVEAYTAEATAGNRILSWLSQCCCGLAVLDQSQSGIVEIFHQNMHAACFARCLGRDCRLVVVLLQRVLAASTCTCVYCWPSLLFCHDMFVVKVVHCTECVQHVACRSLQSAPALMQGFSCPCAPGGDTW